VLFVKSVASPPRLSALLLVAFVMFGSACGGGNNATSNLRPGESVSCTVAVSGAISETADCRPATTSDASAGGEVFQFDGVLSRDDAGSETTVTLVIYFGGPAVTTYKSTDPGVFGGATITRSDGSHWSTLQGGSYQLTFTSVSNRVQYQSGSVYDSEGTLDANLNPVAGSGASGVVTLHAAF
jgi:hypothetical protein